MYISGEYEKNNRDCFLLNYSLRFVFHFNTIFYKQILFLSDNFKNKYKDRSNIIDDVREIEAVNCYPDYSEENVVVVLAEKKHKIFDRDESDDIMK